MNLNTGELLLVAGKGHEKSQDYGKTKLFFSDQEVILESIKRKNKFLSKDLKLNIISENSNSSLSNKLVVKTISSYYRYPLEKTPLNVILDKNVLIKKIQSLKEIKIDNNLINFTILENKNEINIFFDKQTYDLIGWQNTDMYQNFNITFLSSIRKNRVLSKNLFIIPAQN